MIIEIILVTSLAIVALVFRRISVQKRAEKERVTKGLKIVQFIPKIIALCQQHRGISNAVLQGDKSLKQQLLVTQHKIGELKAEGYDLELAIFSQWESFAEHWPRLKTHALDRDLSSQHLIRQHNIMIDGQLSLLDDVAAYYQLNSIMLDDSTRLSSLCLDMLRVTETIAQARGIGAGVCATGHCGGVDKISLNFLRTSLTSATDNLFSELTNIDNPELSERFGSSSTAMKASIGKLVHLLDNQVLIDGTVTVSADEYFETATNPINNLLHVFSNTVGYASEQYLISD